MRKNTGNQEKYFEKLGKILGKIRKNTPKNQEKYSEKLGKILSKIRIPLTKSLFPTMDDDDNDDVDDWHLLC